MQTREPTFVLGHLGRQQIDEFVFQLVVLHAARGEGAQGGGRECRGSREGG